MATTVPDGIWTPDDSTAYNLPVDLAAMADTVQAGLNSVREEAAYRTGTNAERLALPPGGLFDGLRFYATDTFTEWTYTSGAWRLWNAPVRTVTSFGTGWGTASGAGALRTYVRSGVGYLQGSLASLPSGGSADGTVATLPDISYAPKYSPGGVASSAATSGTGSAMIISFFLPITGVLAVNARSHVTPPSTNFPLNMHWLIDLI